MSERRSTILDSAQSLFLSKGYSGTTIADIRDASGASTGSIYHAFGSKEGIALALVQRAVEGWSLATQAAQRGDSIEAQIRASVEGLLLWGTANPEAFRILDELRTVGERGKAGEELATFLDRGKTASRDLLAEHARRGEVRDLPWPLAPALILGPTYEYLRIPQRYPSAEPASTVLAQLSDAAWQAVAL